MAEKILMMALSPTMDQGVIVSWNKKVGDTIVAGDVLCEVETDKATMDYESSQEGVLLAITAKEGARAAVGDMIAVIGKAGEDPSALVSAVPPPAPAAKTDEREPAAPPAVLPVPADASSARTDTPRAESNTPQSEHSPSSGRVKASPLARKLAHARNIDISAIPGSGPSGRIIKRDVESWHGLPSAPDRSISLSGGAVYEDRRYPVSAKRSVIAKRLSESVHTAVQYPVSLRVRADALLDFRAGINAERKKSGQPALSLNAFLVKIAGYALDRHPKVNASFLGDSIVEYGRIDVALAVALTDGLVTPVVRDVRSKGVVRIDEDLKNLIEKAQSGKLTPDDYTGATFTISNLGSFGIEQFQAVINPPNAAILAVGTVQPEPVAVEKPDGTYDVTVQRRMYLTLSADHRILDGADSARFLADFAKIIAEPFSAFL